MIIWRSVRSADVKVADIPNTDHMICSETFDAGACGVIVHGYTGHEEDLLLRTEPIYINDPRHLKDYIILVFMR